MRLYLLLLYFLISNTCSRQCGDLCALRVKRVSTVDVHKKLLLAGRRRAWLHFSNGHGWGPSGSLPTQH